MTRGFIDNRGVKTKKMVCERYNPKVLTYDIYMALKKNGCVFELIYWRFNYWFNYCDGLVNLSQAASRGTSVTCPYCSTKLKSLRTTGAVNSAGILNHLEICKNGAGSRLGAKIRKFIDDKTVGLDTFLTNAASFALAKLFYLDCPLRCNKRIYILTHVDGSTSFLTSAFSAHLFGSRPCQKRMQLKSILESNEKVILEKNYTLKDHDLFTNHGTRDYKGNKKDCFSVTISNDSGNLESRSQSYKSTVYASRAHFKRGSIDYNNREQGMPSRNPYDRKRSRYLDYDATRNDAESHPVLFGPLSDIAESIMISVIHENNVVLNKTMEWLPLFKYKDTALVIDIVFRYIVDWYDSFSNWNRKKMGLDSSKQNRSMKNEPETVFTPELLISEPDNAPVLEKIESSESENDGFIEPDVVKRLEQTMVNRVNAPPRRISHNSFQMKEPKEPKPVEVKPKPVEVKPKPVAVKAEKRPIDDGILFDKLLDAVVNPSKNTKYR